MAETNHHHRNPSTVTFSDPPSSSTSTPPPNSSTSTSNSTSSTARDAHRDARRASALSSLTGLSGGALPPRVRVADSSVVLAEKATLTGPSSSSAPAALDASAVIALGSSAVIHPFARISAASGAVTLDERAVVGEMASVGLGGASSDLDPGSGDGFTPGSAYGADAMQGDAAARAGLSPSSLSSSAATTITTPDSTHEMQGITIGSNAVIHPHAELHAPCSIGDYATVRAGARVGAGCVVGAWSVVGAGVRLPDGARVPERVVVYSCSEALGGVAWRRNGVLAGEHGERVRVLEGIAREKEGEACRKLIRVNLARWV